MVQGALRLCTLPPPATSCTPHAAAAMHPEHAARYLDQTSRRALVLPPTFCLSAPHISCAPSPSHCRSRCPAPPSSCRASWRSWSGRACTSQSRHVHAALCCAALCCAVGRAGPCNPRERRAAGVVALRPPSVGSPPPLPRALTPWLWALSLITPAGVLPQPRADPVRLAEGAALWTRPE